jgi:hypothetical protein
VTYRYDRCRSTAGGREPCKGVLISAHEIETAVLKAAGLEAGLNSKEDEVALRNAIRSVVFQPGVGRRIKIEFRSSGVPDPPVLACRTRPFWRAGPARQEDAVTSILCPKVFPAELFQKGFIEFPQRPAISDLDFHCDAGVCRLGAEPDVRFFLVCHMRLAFD